MCACVANTCVQCQNMACILILHVWTACVHYVNTFQCSACLHVNSHIWHACIVCHVNCCLLCMSTCMHVCMCCCMCACLHSVICLHVLQRMHVIGQHGINSTWQHLHYDEHISIQNMALYKFIIYSLHYVHPDAIHDVGNIFNMVFDSSLN